MFKVIGVGAAGNKAAVELVDQKVIQAKDVTLLNTTTKDFPTGHDDIARNIFSTVLGGCGKEPKEGERAIVKAIKNEEIDPSNYINDLGVNGVIMITSTGGGTGTGATPILVKYYLSMNLTVHVFAFIGFGEDARELKNTLLFFSHLDDNIILHIIDNRKFLDYTSNHKKAELAANRELADQISILLGQDIIESDQNIDQKDLYKLYSTPGYMDIKHIPLDGIKTKDQFNKAIQEAYDLSTSLDVDQSAIRIGCIVNASPKTMNAIDDSFEVIKRNVGDPYELFKHYQYNNLKAEYINILSCGLQYPIEAISKMNDHYKNMKAKVNSNINSFTSILDSLDEDEEDDSMFNLDINKIDNSPDTKMEIKNNIDKLLNDNIQIVTKTIDGDTGKEITPIKDRSFSDNKSKKINNVVIKDNDITEY